MEYTVIRRHRARDELWTLGVRAPELAHPPSPIVTVDAFLSRLT
jgi:hypothetical protein